MFYFSHRLLDHSSFIMWKSNVRWHITNCINKAPFYYAFNLCECDGTLDLHMIKGQ